MPLVQNLVGKEHSKWCPVQSLFPALCSLEGIHIVEIEYQSHHVENGSVTASLLT